ncbi:MAG: hypothetical protein HYT70_01495 [Candidatus Aenigmarchaeota archaeon]|nr:hypothetical protein [Candidatus Aenigmarchaeota archaeon]
MRILQSHADFIEYEPTKREIKQAEEVTKKKYRLKDVVVLFVSVEDSDDESVGKKAIDDVKNFLGKVKCKKILIYPFAHLSRDLANPNQVAHQSQGTSSGRDSKNLFEERGEIWEG